VGVFCAFWWKLQQLRPVYADTAVGTVWLCKGISVAWSFLLGSALSLICKFSIAVALIVHTEACLCPFKLLIKSIWKMKSLQQQNADQKLFIEQFLQLLLFCVIISAALQNSVNVTKEVFMSCCHTFVFCWNVYKFCRFSHRFVLYRLTGFGCYQCKVRPHFECDSSYVEHQLCSADGCKHCWRGGSGTLLWNNHRCVCTFYIII